MRVRFDVLDRARQLIGNTWPRRFIEYSTIFIVCDKINARMWIYDTRHLEILVNRLLSSLVFGLHSGFQLNPVIPNPVQPLGFVSFIHGESLLIGNNRLVFLCVQTNIHSNRTRFFPNF